MAALRLALYIDYQNVFQRARSAFQLARRASDGQFSPRDLGLLLVTRSTPYRPTGIVELSDVRVYRGRPSRKHASYDPWQRQAAAWKRDGVTLVSRPLRGSPAVAREKGIDVALALDFYADARDGRFDIGVLFSMDQDLAPAVEKVRVEVPSVVVETAVWRQPTSRSRLSIVDQRFRTAHPIANHVLEAQDYMSVRDATNYTLKRSARRK